MSPDQRSLVVSSPEFAQDGLIPVKYTCQAEGISPPLVIDNVPKNTHSLVLIMEDPDAPSGTFTHWVLYGIHRYYFHVYALDSGIDLLPGADRTMVEEASRSHRANNDVAGKHRYPQPRGG